MIFWIACLGGLVVAYFLGAIPTGYLAGHLLKGVDLREHGSASTGATNVLRTLGKRAFWAVLFIDVLKGGSRRAALVAAIHPPAPLEGSGSRTLGAPRPQIHDLFF